MLIESETTACNIIKGRFHPRDWHINRHPWQICLQRCKFRRLVKHVRTSAISNHSTWRMSDMARRLDQHDHNTITDGFRKRLQLTSADPRFFDGTYASAQCESGSFVVAAGGALNPTSRPPSVQFVRPVHSIAPHIWREAISTREQEQVFVGISLGFVEHHVTVNWIRSSRIATLQEIHSYTR